MTAPTPLVLGEGEILTTWGELTSAGADRFEIRDVDGEFKRPPDTDWWLQPTVALVVRPLPAQVLVDRADLDWLMMNAAPATSPVYARIRAAIKAAGGES